MEPVAIKPLENVTDARLPISQKESFNYGLVKYGIPIIKSGTAAATTTAIYTVPTGKIFFLTSVSISGIHTAINGDRSFIVLSNNVGYILEMILPRCDVVPEEVGDKTLSFTPPLVFYQGDVIKVFQNATGTATGIITGYELELSMKDQFI